MSAPPILPPSADLPARSLRFFGVDVPRWFLIGIVISSVCAVHFFFKVAIIAPLKPIFKDVPVAGVGYVSLYADVMRAHEFRKISGFSHGYDPSRMAGTLSGVFELQSRPAVTADMLLGRWLLPSQTFRLCLFFSLFCIPLIVFAAARGFGTNDTAALLAMTIAAAGFVNFDFFAIEVFTSGNVFSLVGSHLALLALGAFYAGAINRNFVWYIVLAPTLTLALLFNPASCMSVLVLQILLSLFYINRLSWKAVLAAAGCWLLALICNWFWISPVAANLWFIFPLDLPAYQSHVGFFGYFPFTGDMVQFFIACSRLIVVALFLLGLIRLGLESKPKALVFAIWPLIALSAGQYSFALLSGLPVFLILPIAFAISAFVKTDKVRMLLVAVIFWFHLTSTSVAARSVRVIDGFTDKEKLFLKQFSKPTEGRILVESSPTTRDVVCMLPLTNANFFIGSESEFTSATRRRPAMLLKRRLRTYDHAQLLEMARIYNVKYVAVSSLQARSRFDRFPEDFRRIVSTSAVTSVISAIKPRESFADREYEVVAFASDYMLEGTGSVTAEKNRIVIDNPSLGRLVLKYHWAKSLHASAGVSVAPQMIQGDNIPFIALNNESDARQISVQYQP